MLGAERRIQMRLQPTGTGHRRRCRGEIVDGRAWLMNMGWNGINNATIRQVRIDLALSWREMSDLVVVMMSMSKRLPHV